jgi:AraC-like DNA-binding protein
MNKLLKKAPHPALQPFIKEFWYLYVPYSNHVPRSNTPTPEQAIYFYPKNPPIALSKEGIIVPSPPDNIIIGQSISRLDMTVPHNYLMFKIIFQTGGFYRLFGIPMTVFDNSFIESTLVLGNPIKELREQILNDTSFEEMVKFSEIFLLKKVVNYRFDKLPIDAVMQQMGKQIGGFSLDKLADDACLSGRQFERKFLERTGVTPKLFSRIIRFNQIMKLRNLNTKDSWLKIAYDCGYFDQNHLLRDFKMFTGLVPTNFDFENAIIY